MSVSTERYFLNKQLLVFVCVCVCACVCVYIHILTAQQNKPGFDSVCHRIRRGNSKSE